MSYSGSSEVLPRAAPYDESNAGFADGELRSQCAQAHATSRIAATNADDVSIVQDGEVIGPAKKTAVSVPTFRVPVCRIIRTCAEKQMVGANAGADVTAMQHTQTIWDRPVVQFPRGAVGMIAVEYPISGSALGGSPQPAGVGLLDFGPESVSERGRLTMHRNVPSGVVPTAVPAARRLSHVEANSITMGGAL